MMSGASTVRAADLPLDCFLPPPRLGLLWRDGPVGAERPTPEPVAVSLMQGSCNMETWAGEIDAVGSCFSRLYPSPILRRIRLRVLASEFFEESGSGRAESSCTMRMRPNRRMRLDCQTANCK